jgi:hypothetical protein
MVQILFISLRRPDFPVNSPPAPASLENTQNSYASRCKLVNINIPLC